MTIGLLQLTWITERCVKSGGVLRIEDRCFVNCDGDRTCEFQGEPVQVKYEDVIGGLKYPYKVSFYKCNYEVRV